MVDLAQQQVLLLQVLLDPVGHGVEGHGQAAELVAAVAQPDAGIEPATLPVAGGGQQPVDRPQQEQPAADAGGGERDQQAGDDQGDAALGRGVDGGEGG